VFEKLKTFLNISKKKQPELIQWFKEALEWVETYEKIKDYKNVILAIRELILKHKSLLNYNEELIKKLYVLESSNVEEVSKKAQEKIKKVRDLSSELSSRLTLLEKRLAVNEEKNKAETEKYRKERQEKEYKIQVKEIKTLLKNKEYSKALSLWKKIAFDFPNKKEAIRLLTEVQNAYNKSKIVKEKDSKKAKKVDKILSDIWVDLSVKEKNKWLFSSIREKYREQREKAQSKNEKLKRLRTLSELDKLLVNSWTISDIDGEKIDDNFFNVINTWLTKDVEWFELQWFDIFWKIIWKDKIIWDTFWFTKIDNSKTIFYIWDATGHWVQSWFVVAVLSKLFFDHSKKVKIFKDLFLKLNNELKEKIKWRMFVTSIFFEWDSIKNTLSSIWAGHIPIFIYRKEQNKVEKVIAWWLALWVRLINNVSSIKVKDIELNNWDIALIYTDWILETKDITWNMYWINRFEESFLKAATNLTSPKKIQEAILKEANDFKWNQTFDDDVTLIVFVRDKNKDLISNKAELEKILQESNVKKTNMQIKNTTKQEVIDKIKKEKYDRELKIRLQRLDRLHKVWEYIKLKQDVLIYYKEWFVHDKMKYYLEKAIWNEQKVIAKKQEDKLQKKYQVLLDLYKKWEYNIVIKEAIDVIFKNWKI